MTQRTISKVLIAQEDLALGQGQVNQVRQGASTSVTQIDLSWMVTTLVLLKALDVTKYKHCTLNLSGALRVYYFDATSAETADDYLYIDPDTGTGQWILALDYDRIYTNATAEDTATNINDITSAINTAGKYKGKFVWNTTNNYLLRALGSAAVDGWRVVDGSATFIPS